MKGNPQPAGAPQMAGLALIGSIVLFFGGGWFLNLVFGG